MIQRIILMFEINLTFFKNTTYKRKKSLIHFFVNSKTRMEKMNIAALTIVTKKMFKETKLAMLIAEET